MNQYEQALLSVGQVIDPYAFNHEYAVYGFGGIPRFLGTNQVQHCFSMNGQANPIIQGYNNVFQVYKQVVS